MKVLKFGGTSVGTIESLNNVKRIIEELESPAVVVVSALGGLTDQLIATAKKAKEGDLTYKETMQGIVERHHRIIEGIVMPESREEVEEKVDALLEELGRVYDGVALIRHLSDVTLDLIVSFGERMSSVIVSRILPGLRHVDTLQMVKTEKWFNRNIADSKLTSQLIKETLGDLEGIAIAGGFISTDRDSGEVTNLGRGGSDYTAALIAANLDADVLEIWTDVNGFMTCDPRIVKEALVMDHITFVESMELCTYGAKVIYPPTIYPVFHKNIPIRILNTFHPEAPGTWIDDRLEEDAPTVRGISAIKSTSLLTLRGEMTGNVAEINSRTFNVLAKNGVSVYLVSPPEEEGSFSFAVSSPNRDMALQVLREEFGPELARKELEEIEVKDSLATIAMVGERIGEARGIARRMMNGLEREGIRVYAASEGSSATTVTLVVDEDKTNDALRVIHASFF